MRHPINQIDFYKASHKFQYPKGTDLVYSNFTPRSSKWSNLPQEFSDGIVWFGLQYFMLEFLREEFNEFFFSQPKEEVVAYHKRRLDRSLGGDNDVSHIAALHDLQYLPICIRALPEGTFVPVGVPCMVIYNTHPDFYWVTNFLESVLSTELWRACTSATTARFYRATIQKYFDETCVGYGGEAFELSDFVSLQGHDFSFRGMGGRHDAAISGAGHLTSFIGTDTVPAIDLIEDYYQGNADVSVIGVSVPATEHSVMSMGTHEGEFETFERLINDIHPTGVVSIVSDTWDLWRVLTDYMPRLKDNILSREGKVVVRPDSGDPVDIICGNLEIFQSEKEFLDYLLECPMSLPKNTKSLSGDGKKEVTVYFSDENKYCKVVFTIKYEEYEGYYYSPSIVSVDEITPSPEEKGVIGILYDVFGGDLNEKGFTELSQKVGAIYGDSITPDRCKRILENLKKKGFASNCVVFGVGSFTYGYNTRDTWGFAVKATFGAVNGVSRLIYKDPITDDGTKKSLTGVIHVKRDSSGKLYADDGYEFLAKNDTTKYDEMDVVYYNGEIKEQSIYRIRERVLESIKNNGKEV